MEWSSKQEFLEDIEETSGTTPKALLNKPVICSSVKPFFDGFSVLHRSRSSAFSVGAILPSEIVSYMSVYEQFDSCLFFEIMVYTDSLYLEREGKKEKTAKEDSIGAVPYAQRSNANNTNR